jgi:RNA polymerase sigma-70 factor, ECF subfamily
MTTTGETGTGAQRPGLEELYDLCAPAAFHTALSVLRSPSDAEDIAQDTCLVVFNEVAQGKAIENPKQYASKTAYHLALRELKRTKKIAVLDEAVAIPDQSNAALRGTSLAWQACAAVSVAQRAAVVLTEVEQMSSEEVGRALGVSAASARQLAHKGREGMLKRCVELIAARREQPPECAQRPQQIWSLVVGALGPEQAQELRAHMATCAYCRDIHDQLLYAKSLAAFLPLFPFDSLMSKKEATIRLVAANREIRIGGGWWRRRLAIGAALALLLLLLGSAGLPAFMSRPPKARLAAQPASSAAEIAPAAPTVPPIPPAAFAYLSKGEVWYQTSLSAPAKQLTSTGGQIDFFTWAPDGRSLVYKQRAANTVVGDLHQIDLNSHEMWSLSANAAGFSFSPDGRSWVAAVPVVRGPGPKTTPGRPGIATYRLLFGDAGSPPDPAREIDVPVYFDNGFERQPVAEASLTEPPPLIWSVMPRGIGVWWRGPLIHFEWGEDPGGVDIDPATKTVTARTWTNLWDPDRAYYGPADSPISLATPSATTRPGVLVNGQPVTVVDWPGAVVLLSVSRDGRTGLATYVESSGGHDIAVVGADGSVTKLTNDGTSALGLFEPGSSP